MNLWEAVTHLANMKREAEHLSLMSGNSYEEIAADYERQSDLEFQIAKIERTQYACPACGNYPLAVNDLCENCDQ